MIRYEGQLKNYDFKANSHIIRKHRKGAKSEYYCDDIFTFDIETTSAWVNNHGNIIKYRAGKSSDYWNNLQAVALCYIWQFSVNDTVYFGRGIESFIDVIRDIPSEIHVIIWIHNAAWEIHFLMNILHDLVMFCRQPHKPMKFHSKKYKNIEFRCSYMLTRLKLETWGEQLGVKKLVGFLNYEKIRTPLSKLSDLELQYCERDCIIVYEGIKDHLKRYKNQWDIPLTQTGTVRREVKDILTSDPEYVKHLKTLVPKDAKEYYMLKETFAGGYTHANRLHAGIVQSAIINGDIIEHYDFASHYPAELVKQKYPWSKWIYTGLHEIPDEKSFEDVAYIMQVKFYDIECITFNTYIQAIKCTGHGFDFDNGRVINAAEIELFITEQDYLTIKDTYRWKKIEVKKVYMSYKKYLPTPFIKYLLELYYNKCALKCGGIGAPDYEAAKYDLYMNSKSKINALFGMCVTALLQSDITFDNNTLEWGIETLTEEAVNKHLEKLRNWSPREKRYFLNYSWGIYCTAYARRDLWRCILGPNNENDIDVLYADTDSIFINGKHDFSWYNEETIKKLDVALKYHKLLPEASRPKDNKGKHRQLGIFEKEDNCIEFLTLGAKRYVERREDGKLYLTVSGINKEAVYLLHDDINNFRDGFEFDKDFPTITKKMPTYISEQETIRWPDGYISTCKSGVNLRRNGYKLTLPDKYKKLINYNEFNIGEFPDAFFTHLRGRWIQNRKEVKNND